MKPKKKRSMKIIDITRSIYEGMPVYPTDPQVKIKSFKSIDKGNSSNLSIITMGTHAGTHIDAPAHIFAGSKGVDEISLPDLICDAVLVESRILSSFIAGIRGKNVSFKAVLIKGKNAFITLEQARELVRLGVRLIGTGELSIELPDKEHPVHRYLLRRGISIVENLELGRVKPEKYRLICLPLKIKQCDGSPVRAVLIP